MIEDWKQQLLLPAPGETVRKVRLFSFGGGVQSHSVLVLQVLGRLPNPYDEFVFSDVGTDSEHPETVRYIETVTRPYCEAHGIKFTTVQKTTWGEPETLLQYIYRAERSIPIPVYLQSGAPGNRACTADFKIRVVDRYIRSGKWSYAVVGLGISVDEIERMRDVKWHDAYGKRRFGFWKKREYPLIDLRMSRQDCLNVVAEAGLPAPPRSACWFCPFTSRDRWIEMKINNPKLFEQAIELEDHLNQKRASLNRDSVHIHRDGPLAESVSDQLLLPFEMDMSGAECSGYCFV